DDVRPAPGDRAGRRALAAQCRDMNTTGGRPRARRPSTQAYAIVLALHSRLTRDGATAPIFEVFMFETFKSFISDFVDGEKHPSQFADNDYRLAAAALLVRAAGIDGEQLARG